MHENIAFVNSKKIERTIDALEKNNMKGYLVKNKEELYEKIKELTPEGSLIGCGGSETLLSLGLIDFFREGNYNFLDRYRTDLNQDTIKDLHRKAFCSDVYFSSTNAITETGHLYNVDGNGNRIAAMLYGPDKVIIICGVNKIVKNIDEAIERNRAVSAPANAKRIGTKTPCTSTGYCVECSSPSRICCEYSIIKKQRTADRIHVIFMNEYLGY